MRDELDVEEYDYVPDGSDYQQDVREYVRMAQDEGVIPQDVIDDKDLY